MIDKSQSETDHPGDNVVYLDPARRAGMAQGVIADQGAPQLGPLIQIAFPGAAAMQMALQMYLLARGYSGTQADRATITMLAISLVTAGLLHELGAHAPEHQAAVLRDIAESVRLNLELLKAGIPS